MAESRFIVNEVQRNIGGLSVENLQSLIDSSPTLKHLVETGYRGIITPQNIEKILREIQSTQKTKFDVSSLAQTINNINNNPFFITPEESQLSKEYSSYEDIPLNNKTLLTTLEGNVFIDPETGSYILAPTPNVQITAPEKSKEGYVGDLNPVDIENFNLILEDEIRIQREARGEEHSDSAVSTDGRMGAYGITVEDLISIGVVSQSAVDIWNNIAPDAHEDYAAQAVSQGLISSAIYDNIPIALRTSLYWYILSHKEYWLEKLIGPKAFLLYKKIQKALSYRILLQNWKTTFRFFALNFINSKAQQAAHLLLQRLFGKRADQLFGLGAVFTSEVGRAATDIFNRAAKAIETNIEANTAAQLDTAAKKIPDPPTPQPKPARKFKAFANIKTQPTNESLVRIPPAQGFYDPNRVYPRVTHIGEPDTNRLARGQKIKDTIVGAKDDSRLENVPVARGVTPGKWSQPKSPYNAKYPYNHVYESESGHVIEYDDTRDNERLHWYHREGTFMEIDRNGTWTRKIIGDGYEIYERDGNIYIGGRANITVEGNCNLYVKTDVNLEVDGDVTADVHKNMKFNIAKNFDVTVGQDINFKAKGNIKYFSENNFDVRANKTLKMSGDNASVRANKVLTMSGESKASLAAPNGQALLLAGVGAVVVNGTALGLMPQPGQAAKALAQLHMANPATPANVGAPPAAKNPQEPKLPPLVLESRVDRWAEAMATLAENPDENQNEIAVLKKKGIDEGLVTKEELDRPLTRGAEDTSPVPPTQPAKVASCNIIYGENNWPPTYRLSSNVTMGMLKGTDQLNNQHGLTKQDIVCNLKQLCENVIEPVFSLIGKNQVLITSCFRYPGYNTGSFHPAVGVSFHEQGLAVDMCFINKPFSKYFDIATQFKQAIQYDKLLLEYRIGTVRGVSTYKPWVHIQWQQPAINLANGIKGGPARKEVFVMKNDERETPNGTLVNLLPDSTLTY